MAARYGERVPDSAPPRRPRLFTAGLVLFALGLLGILAVFLSRPVANVNPPLALYLTGMLLPVGLFLAVFSAFRDGRAR
jgi:protein-S-isoprenylcysteine O-methyltransferase Ste14